MSVNSAEIHAVFGATESGKSIYFKSALLRDKPRRLFIWDARNEYGQFAEPVASLVDLYKATKKASFKLRFYPGRALEPKQLYAKFNSFCEIAANAQDLTVGVEELRMVTQSGWAPTWWRELSGAGRHDHLVIYGMSQRPAQIDKDFFSNATYIRTGRVNDENDVRRLAGVLFVKPEEILSLGVRQFIHRDTRTGNISRGTIEIPRGLQRA
jgi:hypothetical protein